MFLTLADFIQISSLFKSSNYRIYNSLGIEISHRIISANKKIDIKSLANGLYFLKIENSKTIKFIKKQ